MHDVKGGVGIKYIFDLVRKYIHGIFKTKNPTTNQIRNVKDLEENGLM